MSAAAPTAVTVGVAGGPGVAAVLVAVLAMASAAVLVMPRRGSGAKRLGHLVPPRGGTGRQPSGSASGPAAGVALPVWGGAGVRSVASAGVSGVGGSARHGTPTESERAEEERLAGARRSVRLRRVVLVGVAGALVATIGVVPGLLVGAVGGVIADQLLGRLEPAAERRRKAQLVEDLPAFADLLAATTRAGVPMVRAAAVCSHALGGPLGAAGTRVATSLQLGADPEQAWALLTVDEATRPLADAMIRAAVRGLAPASALATCAGEARRARAHAAARRSQSVGVAAAAPLGFCFLPAFVLLAVVPTVVGMLSRMF